MGVTSSKPDATHANKPEQRFLKPVKRADITDVNIEGLFRSEAYRVSIANRLSGAVKIPTVTYDGMGKPGEDDRWDIFYEMTVYLERTFPKV